MAMDSRGNWVPDPRPLQEQVFRSLMVGPHYVRRDIITDHQGKVAVMVNGAVVWATPAPADEVTTSRLPVWS